MDIPRIARQPRPRRWIPTFTLVAVIAATTAYASISPANSLDWLRHLASSGDTGAQVELGLAYRDGRYGLKADAGAGVRWLAAAAKAGDAYAADALANAYAVGKGVGTDPDQALYWWRKAAEGGNADAQARLGDALLARGDDDTGLDWLRAAADRGDPGARKELARLYQERSLPEADLHRGENALAAVAERSHDDSLRLVLTVWNTVARGSLAPQTGSALIDRARRGDPVAQYQLAMRYRDGAWGVTCDPGKALLWLRRSARAGNRVAIRTLAEQHNRSN